MNTPIKTCPCCSFKEYEKCCEPFHKGTLCKTAEELMRSRYSAYALHLPDYIILTTHQKCPQYQKDHLMWKKQIEEFSKTFTFEKLEILAFKENGSRATVTFRAHLTHGKEDASFTEKSTFEKIKGRWLYLSGEIS